jgi:hypothetical protein
VQPPHGLLLEQTGHLPQLERPTVVAQALAAFAAQAPEPAQHEGPLSAGVIPKPA